MDYSGPVSDVLSPESTVTSLLSSSGHLRSSLRVPEHNTTFRYRDKDYESASAALDAYIADYERSQQNRESLTGRLVLPHIPPLTPRRPGVSTLRNKDVLREHLTERELHFLNLPVSSLHHRANRDRLSMTTDELLSIPRDGSMPVTHTSAFIQGLMSQSAASHPHLTSSRPAHRPWDGLSSNHTAPRINHNHSHTTRVHKNFRGRSGTAMLKPDVDFSSGCCFKSSHRAARSERADPSLSLHLPHWLTSNKSEMNCSGITSVPDLKYPAWVQHCDLSEPPMPAESELWDHDHGVPQPGGHRARAPSWVEELEDDVSDQTSAQVDSQQTLRDLRLQFAEQISLLAAEKKSSDIMETLCRDNKIESLIQKADQVLNSLSQNSGGAGSRADSVSISDRVEKDFSPLNTEQFLHCPQFTQDSAAAGVDMEALTDRGAQECSLHGNSSLKQPGPAEALKQMLFRLQAVEAELQRQQATPTETENLQTDKTPVKRSAKGEAELECVSGGASLQRALHHLSRLKMLVEEPREKRTQEVEEKDEDEGRYSSSSADGLSSIQQKPS
ncbi:lung adenoma susceptibility protein 2 [Cheilinus undulatus]|uniref:lung adenoma susceptibility protein 2 n=1 Tax=Cheilinus undulatus TaxID=241271 RepID=UPI001BD52108|nr:lung adenoma susceptibility protein 2 [Cheilinus undulatus]XP_041667104.1 lung adenoma susceptibility protein 2 [Cheilinus undulatus]